MTGANDNFTSELEMLHSKLTVLEKGRHEGADSDANIRECQERIAALEEKQEKPNGDD